MEDIHFVGFLSKLLETKIIQVLRFKYGQVCMHVFCRLFCVIFYFIWAVSFNHVLHSRYTLLAFLYSSVVINLQELVMFVGILV